MNAFLIEQRLLSALPGSDRKGRKAIRVAARVYSAIAEIELQMRLGTYRGTERNVKGLDKLCARLRKALEQAGAKELMPKRFAGALETYLHTQGFEFTEEPEVEQIFGPNEIEEINDD